MALYISVVICGIGFAGMLIFFVFRDEPKLLFSLGIMGMGDAGRFSAQTRALALAWRMRHLPRYRPKDAPSDTDPAPDHAGAEGKPSD